MSSVDTNIFNLIINSGDYETLLRNLSQMNEGEFVFIEDKGLPIPTASDNGKLFGILNGNYALLNPITKLSDLTDDLGNNPTHTHSQYLTSHQSLSGYATQTWVSQQGFITKVVNDLTNYYTKTQTYSKSEVDTLLSSIQRMELVSVNELPTASAETMDKIYLVPSQSSSVGNVKDEYVTIRSGSVDAYTYSWEQFGSTSIDLSNYYTSTTIDSLLNAKQNVINNDNKLPYSLISGTPTIPTNVSDLTNDSGYLTEHQSLTEYATQTWVQNQGYLTSHQSLTGYATKTWVGQQGYLTSANLSGYATQQWVEGKGYLTSHQSLNGYATETWVQQRGYITDISGKQDKINDLATIRSGASAGSTAVQPAAIADMATKTWVSSQGYLTSHQTLNGYATQTWVQNQGYLTAHQSLSGYATQTWVQNQGYLTAHQSLADYYNQIEIDSLLANKLGSNENNTFTGLNTFENTTSFPSPDNVFFNGDTLYDILGDAFSGLSIHVYKHKFRIGGGGNPECYLDIYDNNSSNLTWAKFRTALGTGMSTGADLDEEALTPIVFCPSGSNDVQVKYYGLSGRYYISTFTSFSGMWNTTQVTTQII